MHTQDCMRKPASLRQHLLAFHGAILAPRLRALQGDQEELTVDRHGDVDHTEGDVVSDSSSSSSKNNNSGIGIPQLKSAQRNTRTKATQYVGRGGGLAKDIRITHTSKETEGADIEGASLSPSIVLAGLQHQAQASISAKPCETDMKGQGVGSMKRAHFLHTGTIDDLDISMLYGHVPNVRQTTTDNTCALRYRGGNIFQVLLVLAKAGRQNILVIW